MKDWPAQDAAIVGQKNVINKSLVNHDRIIVPSLHIKIGLMKQFAKVLNTVRIVLALSTFARCVMLLALPS